jgi:hypothetical protein
MKTIFQPNPHPTNLSQGLDPFLALYVTIMNANDGPAFETLFTSDAVVKDEGHEYQGAAAIGGWLAEVHRKYRPFFEATEVSKSGSETVISGVVSGTFDGSPIDIFHHLTIVDRQIAALTIRG